MNNITITLKPGKEKSLLNKHPWVFSGAIAKISGKAEDGDFVQVYSSRNEYLAGGLYNNGSISVRLITFSEETPSKDFFVGRLQKAYQLRRTLTFPSSETSVYRLTHGEGDGLPGLIIDVYNSVAVIQAHTLGMYRLKEHITEALKEVLGKEITAIYDKSKDTLPGTYGDNIENGYLWGETVPNHIVNEHSNKFYIDVVEGQKTGFFIDQRENRKLVGEFCKGKDVLNTFCYSGGFSIYALSAGANSVDSVDSSKKAMELTDKNVELNGFKNHTSYTADVFDFLKSTEKKYDVIILDPPAFAKHIKALSNAAMGYQRINTIALQKIKPGGILFTFSCSQAVSKDLFRKILFASAVNARRNVRILHQLSQPADHPISIFHPEGEYLKGLVLHVE